MTGLTGDDQIIINTIGHAAGVLIFGIFLYLVIQRKSAARLRGDGLPLAAAALALLWNLASLIVLSLGANTDRTLALIVAAAGFSLLSVLPAVLLNLCLVDRYPWLIRAGYALSAIAVTAHIVEFMTEVNGGVSQLHRVGVFVITVGFGVLTGLAVLLSFLIRRTTDKNSTSKLLGTMSLFLLAISFAHFGDGHHIDQLWSQELAFHHAGIPLALFVLMQEYRFILIDAFIRFLANGMLAGVFGWIAARIIPAKPIAWQIVLGSVIVGAFAIGREVLQKVLTHVVFRQPDPAEIDRVVQALRAHHENEEQYLQTGSEKIAQLMGAPFLGFAAKIFDSARPTGAALLADPVFASLATTPDFRLLQNQGVVVIVPIRLAHDDVRYGLLGERPGGRPYLSEDLDVLSHLANTAAEQVERIRAAETSRLVSGAELRALQAQIHPHFLFNAFNTLYGIIPRPATAARNTVLNLADIFRYFLRGGQTFAPAFVSLEEEMRIVQAYLAIETQRLGEAKLQVQVEIDPTLLRETIPILSLEPLVENAVKHGIASRPQGGRVTITVQRAGADSLGTNTKPEANTKMIVSVADSGRGVAPDKNNSVTGAGMGLDNVSRRLQLCYGPDTEVKIERGETGWRVSFVAPCKAAPPLLATARH